MHPPLGTTSHLVPKGTGEAVLFSEDLCSNLSLFMTVFIFVLLRSLGLLQILSQRAPVPEGHYPEAQVDKMRRSIQDQTGASWRVLLTVYKPQLLRMTSMRGKGMADNTL